MKHSASDWNSYSGFEGRNWSSEYSRLLLYESEGSKVIWTKDMFSLGSDFFHAASLYAQVIISELPLPCALKSIQPVSVGGIAGGEKFIVDNILFKFASDSKLGNTNVYMYGGPSKRDDLAMKAANVEMRNMQTVITGIRGTKLLAPLMCVIDFQGYRMIASAILPIDNSTIVYGSSDAGYTVHCSNSEVNEMVDILGDKLNLKKHLAGCKSSAKELVMPGDIEVHKGKDDNYYIIDVARLMPPESPNSEEAYEVGSLESRKIYYQTLRPELVQGFCEKLSSDAYSGWSQCDVDKEEHKEAVQRCTDFLKNDIIPSFSDALENFKLETISILPETKEEWMSMDRNNLITLLSVADMSEAVHYYGINVRHLGLIRSHLKKKNFRDFMLLQILSRVMKNILREDMRKIMKKSKGSPTDLPLRDLVLKTYYNILSTDTNSNEIKKYWKKVYKTALEQYEYCFTNNEIQEIDKLGLYQFSKERIDFRTLLYLFFKFARVKLSETALCQMLVPTIKDGILIDSSFKLVRSDIQTFTPRIRKPYISSIAAGLILQIEANEFSTSNQNSERLMNLAAIRMQAAHHAAPACPLVNKLLGDIYWQLSKLVKNAKTSIDYKLHAIRHIEFSLSSKKTEEMQNQLNTLLDETENQLSEQNMDKGIIQRIRVRNHDGIANCVSKRLKTEYQ